MRTSIPVLAFLLSTGTCLAQEWTTLNSGTTMYLSDVAFGSSSTGVVVGGASTILSTNDGGNTWTPRTAAIPAQVLLKGVCFSSPTTVWVVGDHETLLKSTDGGVNWTVISNTNSSMAYEDIAFISPQVGYLVGGTGVATGLAKRTTDGGATWTTSPIEMQMVAIHANPSGEAWACGYRGVINHTVNGVDWVQQTEALPNQLTNLQNVYMLNDEEGWVVGPANTIYHTTDGGANWEALLSGTNAGLTGIYFSDPLNGWAVSTTSIIGGYPIRRTTNGTSWTTTSNYLTTLNNLFFLNPSLGWAVGENGFIVRYDDGTVGVQEPSPEVPLTITPNPATDRLTIHYDGTITDATVLNTAGQEVLRASALRGGLDVSTLAPGSYTVRVTTDAGLRGGRFIKE